MIRFSCPTCGKRLKAPDHGVGRKTSCPRCGQRLLIPAPVQAQNKTVLGQPMPDPTTTGAPAYGPDTFDVELVPVPLPPSVPGQSPAEPPGLDNAVLLGIAKDEELEGPEQHRYGPPVRLPPVAHQPPAEEVRDALPADDGLPGPPRQTPIPAHQVYQHPGPLPIPRFTEEGALIKCPHCNRNVHLMADEFNRRVICPRCDGGIRAVVASRGYIPMDCQECGYDMEISERQAGRTTDCPNCNATVWVPVEPIMVLKANKPPDSDLIGPAAVAGLVVGAAISAGYSPGPRCCAICGRYIRNPSSYCYRCQKWLGW
jgi:hypothetical protein